MSVEIFPRESDMQDWNLRKGRASDHMEKS